MCKDCLLTRVAIIGATLFMAIHVFGQNKIETVVQQGHLSQVLCSAVSADGNYIATGSADNSVKLWNAQNGKEIRSFKHHSGSVFSVSFTNDGNYLLSASADNHAILVDVRTGEVIHRLAHGKIKLEKAVFSANDKFILTSSNRNDLFLWDANTGKLKRRYDKSFSADISEYTMNASGNRILSAGDYSGFYTNTISSGDSIMFEFDKPYSMSFSPNGEFVVAGSNKLFAGIFDARTGKELFRLNGTSGAGCDGCKTIVAISNDNKLVATAGRRADFIIWNAEKGTSIKTLETDLKDYVQYLFFSPNGKYVAMSTNKSVFVYEVKSGKLKFTWSSSLLSYYEPVFSPNDANIITPGDNNTAYVWDIESQTKQKILTGYLNQRSDGGMDLEYSDWTERHILRYVTKKAGMTITPDGKYILKGRVDSVVVMIDINTGKEVRTFSGHTKSVLGVDVSPDGKLLATGGGDGRVCIWDIKTGKKLHTLRGHSAMVFDVHFSHSGTKLASSSWDAITRVWDVTSGESQGYIMSGEVSQFVNRFMPGDLYLATGNLDKTLALWEVDSREQFRSYVGHTDIITDVDFSSNGNMMTSTSWDGYLKIWNTSSGMLTNKFQHDGSGLFSVVVDQVSSYIYSGGGDGKIGIWDPRENKKIGELDGHSGAVVSLKLTPDNKLVSCSDVGIIKVWDLSENKELYTYMIFDRDNWLVKHSSGRFDGSSSAMKMVNYVSGMEVVPVGSLFKKYYAPGLLKRIMRGEEFKDIGQNLESEIRSAPMARIALSGAGKRTITVGQDSVVQWRKEKIPLTVIVDESEESLGDIRIYRNGKLIVNESFIEEIEFRGGEENSRTFDVQLSDGSNEISVVVSNKRSIESEPAVLKVNYDGEAALTDLYIISIGINQYKNPAYKLNYAVNDADAFVGKIKDGAGQLFHSVKTYEIRDTEADKAHITEVFEKVIKEIGPEDVFIFYYAGHGVMSVEKSGSEFFVVTHDVTNFYGSVDMLNEKAISAEELMVFSRQISAEKQLFVMDACQSGGALQAFAQRGAVREKALAQLARSTGTFFLTASEDAQYANEVGGLEHGMFTYAILEALGGTADGGGDAKVTVNELRTYVEDRVPELSEQYQGSPQYPTSYSFGQDFPVSIVVTDP